MQRERMYIRLEFTRIFAWTFLGFVAQGGRFALAIPAASPSTQPNSIFSSPSFNVTRVFNGGDVFSNGDSRCDPKNCVVYGAVALRSSPCHCQCPNRAPAFLQHIRQCSNTIDECHVLEFNQSNSRQRIPTQFLPLTGQIFAGAAPLDWEGAGIKLDSSGNSPCTVFNVGYLTVNGWTQLDNAHSVFSLLNSDGHPYLQWLGSKHEQILLTGKIVQVTFQCGPAGSVPDLCAVFRVIGKDASSSPLEIAASTSQLAAGSNAVGTSSNERANQLGLIVGVVCGALLAVTLVSVAVFWTVCWKQQKERLARKMQLHVIYQQQRMQQQAAAGTFPHLAHAFNAANEPNVSSTIEMLQGYGGITYNPYIDGAQQLCWPDGSQHNVENALALQHYNRAAVDQLLPPPPPYPQARKKLYFSPEFFEPDLMADPPPVAEEFLYEVRRMIDLAKNRIRSRRYIPSLLVIPEEGGKATCDDRKASTYSACSARVNFLERRDSFSKMAQEPAPEETLTIQEIEEERQHADSPHSSDATTASHPGADSGDSTNSSTNDRSFTGSDHANTSLDSGLGDSDKPGSRHVRTINGQEVDPTSHGENKVSHWLSRLPQDMELSSGAPEAAQEPRHSKLYTYFNARQRLVAQQEQMQKQLLQQQLAQHKALHKGLASANADTNIIRVQVNHHDGLGTQDDLSPRSKRAEDDRSHSSPTPYKRRYSVPTTAPTQAAQQVPWLPNTVSDFRTYKQRTAESDFLKDSTENSHKFVPSAASLKILKSLNGLSSSSMGQPDARVLQQLQYPYRSPEHQLQMNGESGESHQTSSPNPTTQTPSQASYFAPEQHMAG